MIYFEYFLKSFVFAIFLAYAGWILVLLICIKEILQNISDNLYVNEDTDDGTCYDWRE